MQRGQFSSRLAFVLAASGSAVGLGNIWGFPTNAAENGGAAFVLMYLILAFLLAYPALMAELIIGRHTRSNMADALTYISNSGATKQVGRLVGFAGLLTASLILCFYCIVAGWMLGHMIAPVMKFFKMPTWGAWFTEFGLWRNISLAALFMMLTALVISAGVEQGIEKWSRRLMPSLLMLLVSLIGYVLLQEGSIEGLKHYLVPDFSQMADPELVVSALGQAFFSMSLGVGTMLIYGSYLGSHENITRLGIFVTLADTGIAVLAGLLILPAIFVAQNLGVEIYAESGNLIAGPDLIFQVLPALFQSMGIAGLLVSFAFFILLSIAALTSSISMLEVPVSYAVESHNLNRAHATWVIAILIFSVSVSICMNFEQTFGLIITITTEWSQPILSMFLCLFAGWVFHRQLILAELRRGNEGVEATLFWSLWPIYVKFLCPALILILVGQKIF